MEKVTKQKVCYQCDTKITILGQQARPQLWERRAGVKVQEVHDYPGTQRDGTALEGGHEQSSMPRWRTKLRKTITLGAKKHMSPNFPQKTVQC